MTPRQPPTAPWFTPLWASWLALACAGPAPEGVDADDPQDPSGAPSTATLRAEVWADNWFSMSAGDRSLGEDSVPITTERSFNAETFTFEATLPLRLHLVLKDYKADDTGLEYLGTDRQQAGDGGFIAQVTDVATGALVGASDAGMRCWVIHAAPLDPSCAAEPLPTVERCGATILDEPNGWREPDFDVQGWESATTYTEAEIGVKEGYLDISWDPRARLVWTSDLHRDNTLLCTLDLAAP
jgi:hypothetical protein